MGACVGRRVRLGFGDGVMLGLRVAGGAVACGVLVGGGVGVVWSAGCLVLVERGGRGVCEGVGGDCLITVLVG